MNVLYLHGFASSAQSTKGAFLAGRFASHGVTLHAPDFNEPDFSTLTITRMVEQVEAAIDALPRGGVVLIGSSLGAFVAVQVALRDRGAAGGRAVDRLVLLAPALDFSGERLQALGDRALDEWQRTGHLNVFHYGYGRMLPLHYALYTDACGYDCLEARLSLPILILQGRHDTAVDPAMVERWAASRPNVTLHLLDDDHQLGGSLERIWAEVKEFLRLD